MRRVSRGRNWADFLPQGKHGGQSNTLQHFALTQLCLTCILHMHIHTHTHTQPHIQAHTHTRICKQMQTHVSTQTHTLTHSHFHAQMYTHVHMHLVSSNSFLSAAVPAEPHTTHLQTEKPTHPLSSVPCMS